jgi:tRNA(fMet)-specific endonuclease VapC
VILDTTVLVDLLHGDEEAKKRVAELEEAGELLWVPTPVVCELWEGIERADRPEKERQKVVSVLDGYTVLAFDAKHAAKAGITSGALARRGEMIDPYDAQIAGVALAEDRSVLTRNVKHFKRVTGLDVETY